MSIIEKVTKVPHVVIKEGRRYEQLITIKRVFIHLTKEHTVMEVADYLGYKNHAVILHHRKKELDMKERKLMLQILVQMKERKRHHTCRRV